MNRGDIWIINLGPVAHSEIGLTRPGLILSIDAMNQHGPRLIIAPITSNVGKLYPFEVFLSSGSGGLDRDSKIMLDQIRSLDKKRLVRKIGLLEKDVLISAAAIACKLITVV